MSTIVTETVRAAFPFNVNKLPLFGPDNLRTPHYGLFRSDTGDSVGVACKQTYEPHTIDDVCTLVEAAASAFDGGEATARCLFRDGHYVTIAPSNDYRRAIFGTSDCIWPRLTIRAGYDGRAFSAQLGYYRDCCRNLAIVRAADGRNVSANIKHTRNLPTRLKELRKTFAELAGNWDGVVETARALESRAVNLADFVRAVYPQSSEASERSQRAAERRAEAIIRRVVRERVATGREVSRLGRDYVVSAWEAFNAIQGYVQHDMSRHGRPDEFTRAVIALDDAAVSRALDLALAA